MGIFDTIRESVSNIARRVADTARNLVNRVTDSVRSRVSRPVPQYESIVRTPGNRVSEATRRTVNNVRIIARRPDGSVLRRANVSAEEAGRLARTVPGFIRRTGDAAIGEVTRIGGQSSKTVQQITAENASQADRALAGEAFTIVDNVGTVIDDTAMRTLEQQQTVIGGILDALGVIKQDQAGIETRLNLGINNAIEDLREENNLSIGSIVSFVGSLLADVGQILAKYIPDLAVSIALLPQRLAEFFIDRLAQQFKRPVGEWLF